MEPRDLQAAAVAWQRLLFLLIASKALLQREEKPSNAVHTAFSCPGSFRQSWERLGAVITVYPCIKGSSGIALRRAIALTAESRRAERGRRK